MHRQLLACIWPTGMLLLRLATSFTSVLALIEADQLYFNFPYGLNMSNPKVTRDVAYGPHPAQKFDVYLPPADTNVGPATIVFVHGGAWRSEDKSDHEGLALRILQATSCPIVVLNYQLSPRLPTSSPTFQHPSHTLDVLSALDFLKQQFLDIPQSSRANIYLVGHSCGAHMIASLVLDSPAERYGVATPPEILSSIKGAFLSSGIYDIDLLLKKYPDYSDFIQGAFGHLESYRDVSPAHFHLRGDTPIYWLVVHSKGDTLVNEEQAESFWERLWELYDHKAHQYVEADWERLTVGHHELLREQKFSDMVAQFVKETTEKRSGSRSD